MSEVVAGALASMPLRPDRLRALVLARPSIDEVWEEVRAGRLAQLGPFVDTLPDATRGTIIAECVAAARSLDLDVVARRMAAVGARARLIGEHGYPARLAADPDPPAIVFERGALPVSDAVRAPTVAIVGTRRCTNYGRDVAAQLGRDLAAAGVVVVSGLALGIDGAAHEGALAADAAPPVGVVGSGVDVVYPRRHRRLWERVASAGVIVGEAPMGSPGMAFRFPLRNRIIASLADLVIVVESHARGGSMHTVHAAIDRSVPVMAVPGSVKSPSSAGTNRLLSEGIAPVLDVDDVLVALSLHGPRAVGSDTANSQSRPHVEGPDSGVLDAVDWVPTPTEVVLQRTGLDLGPAAAALTRLEMIGLVRAAGGSWERC